MVLYHCHVCDLYMCTHMIGKQCFDNLLSQRRAETKIQKATQTIELNIAVCMLQGWNQVGTG